MTSSPTGLQDTTTLADKASTTGPSSSSSAEPGLAQQQQLPWHISVGSGLTRASAQTAAQSSDTITERDFLRTPLAVSPAIAGSAQTPKSEQPHPFGVASLGVSSDSTVRVTTDTGLTGSS